MLRESSESFGYAVDLRAVADPQVESRVPGGGALLGLVDAFFGLDGLPEDAVATLRNSLGDPSFVDAAAVFANFEMMNRVAEGTGIPVAPQSLEREADIVEMLGLADLMKDGD